MKLLENNTILILIILLLAGYSCEMDEKPFISESDELYIGFWKETGYEDELQIFTRVAKLDNNNYSFGILSDGTFLENKNSGFCGTPPISYAKYEGKWLEVGKDSLKVETDFWGGDMVFILIIKSVSREKMAVKMDYVYLQNLGD